MDSALWTIVGAVIAVVVTGIAILLQLGAASKERLEAMYERLLSQLNDVVRELGGWDGKKRLSVARKRRVARMLHMHLDSLVESIATEGRSWWRGFLHRLSRGRMYTRVGGKGGKWFLANHRYQRFEKWYTGILVLYKEMMGLSNYVEEVFHPAGDDPHYTVESLEEYFTERLKDGT